MQPDDAASKDIVSRDDVIVPRKLASQPKEKDVERNVGFLFNVFILIVSHKSNFTRSFFRNPTISISADDASSWSDVASPSEKPRR